MYVINMKRFMGVSVIMILLSCSMLVSAQQPFSAITQSSTEDGHILFSTAGPLTHRHVTINIDNGTEEVLQQINRVISMKLIHLFVPILVIPASHLNFTISYKKTVLLPRSGNSYYTSVATYDNGEVIDMNTIINKPHSLIVKDFGGYFLFSRARPLRIGDLGPAKFMFVGSCEHVLVLT